MLTLAIVSPGEMGQAVGRLLARSGCRVVVTLSGRSERTRALAANAGLVAVPTLDDLVREADMLLSIVPPASAMAVAGDVASALDRTGRRLVFVDCNAVAPTTVRRVAATLAPTGCGFADVGIVGSPPRDGVSPRFYASGPERQRVALLGAAGLDVRILGETIGEASAVKMCYAALTKGTTALATELLIAARRLGVYDSVMEAIGESEQLRGRTAAVPTMTAKAHRWVAEMEEIALTFAETGLTPRLFEGAADVYRTVAASPLGRERPETVDRSRGLAATVDALAAPPKREGSPAPAKTGVEEIA